MSARFLPRLGAKLALALGALLAALVAAELVARAFLGLAGRPYDEVDARRAIDAEVDAITRQLPNVPGRGPVEPGPPGQEAAIPSPWCGWETAGYLDASAEQQADFRGPSAGTYRVCILGGSVAGGFAAYGTEALAGILHADPRFGALRFHFLNQGRGGYKQPQQTALLAWLYALGYRFEAVIEIDGFNEAALACYNAEHGSSPLYPSASHWGHLTADLGADTRSLDLVLSMWEREEQARDLRSQVASLGLARSCLAGELALLRLGRLRRGWSRSYTEYVERFTAGGNPLAMRGPAYEPGLAEALRLSVAAWEESSISLAALCRAHGSTYLQVLQPTLYDQGSKPLTEEELAAAEAPDSWRDGAREGYPLLRAGLERLRARGLPVLDATGVFRETEEPIYYDFCHFRERGNELLAAEVARGLLAEIERDAAASIGSGR